MIDFQATGKSILIIKGEVCCIKFVACKVMCYVEWGKVVSIFNFNHLFVLYRWGKVRIVECGSATRRGV